MTYIMRYGWKNVKILLILVILFSFNLAVSQAADSYEIKNNEVYWGNTLIKDADAKNLR